MWAICDRFHLLPSNPALATLTPLHKNWIIANLLDEAERMSDIEKPTRPGVTRKTMGIDAEEFKLFSQRQRELAEEARMAGQNG